MHDSATRRVAALTRQLLPSETGASNGVCSSSSVREQNLVHHATSADSNGKDSSSYARVHGEVSREPANWTSIPSVQQQRLKEVLYDKALEEGIAKVGPCTCQSCPAN